MTRLAVTARAAVAVLAAATLAACSSSAAGPSQVLSEVDARAKAAAVAASPSPATATTAAAQNCSPGAEVSYAPLASLPAPGAMPPGTLEATIARRGYLVVGVSGDTRLLGARNSLAGGQLEGFDIEIARTVARAIFGTADGRVRFRVITAAERIPQVNAGVDNGGVDMVARAMTMTCDRWRQVAFSASYFSADQILLAPQGREISVARLAKAGARVCAARGSTNLGTISAVAGIVPVAADIDSDCLALLQQGRVDAITSDDAILAGYADQDPRVSLGTEKLGAQPYGLALSLGHPEFVRFVNAVLASPAGRAAWQSAFSSSRLATYLGQKTQPTPQYGR